MSSGAGWKIDTGPRGDRYWLPPGVERRPPWQNRKDYFDSKLQVVRHLRDEGNMVVEVGADDTSRAKAPKVREEAKVAAAKASAGPKKRPPPAPAAPESRKAAKTGSRSEWGRVWAELEQSGWRLEEVGQRRDRYYLPPGVSRGPGKKNRVDYFDSRKLVLEHLEQLRQKSGRGRGGGAVLKRPSAAAKTGKKLRKLDRSESIGVQRRKLFSLLRFVGSSRAEPSKARLGEPEVQLSREDLEQLGALRHASALAEGLADFATNFVRCLSSHLDLVDQLLSVVHSIEPDWFGEEVAHREAQQQVWALATGVKATAPRVATVVRRQISSLKDLRGCATKVERHFERKRSALQDPAGHT
eukprot:s702_g2.t1